LLGVTALFIAAKIEVFYWFAQSVFFPQL
jgi:hypothetical protein